MFKQPCMISFESLHGSVWPWKGDTSGTSYRDGEPFVEKGPIRAMQILKTDSKLTKMDFYKWNPQPLLKLNDEIAKKLSRTGLFEFIIFLFYIRFHFSITINDIVYRTNPGLRDSD